MAEYWAIGVAIWGTCKLFLCAGFGAFVLYVLNELNDRQPFSLFTALRIKMRDPARPGMVFIDMIVSSAIGAGVVLALFDPAATKEAMSLGLGLTGILSAYGKDV